MVTAKQLEVAHMYDEDCCYYLNFYWQTEEKIKTVKKVVNQV